MLLAIYRTAMRLSTPLLEAYLRKRASRGKEDVARAHERRGRPLMQRPAGPLVWFHAASVGESLSLLAVIGRILADHPACSVMVTTGTVTSAKLMAERLPRRSFHQYMPVDHPAWVRTFLDHWRPDAIGWAESELWPNILAEIKARGIPAVLLNARMSEDTFRKWRLAPAAIGSMLSAFGTCLAQNEAEARRLRELGARDVRVSTNLKYAAPPLPADEAELAVLERDTAGRTLLLWASTHPGEEDIAFRLHRKLKASKEDLLTVIVPRHPQRGAEIGKAAAGFSVALRSRGENAAGSEIYIADTLGELGLFYRLCRTVVMGGTFADVGGHNPIEPAQLGCLIFSGPMTYNFITVTEDFARQKAIVLVGGEDALADKISVALAHPEAFAGVAASALSWTKEKAGVLDEVAALFGAHLSRASVAAEKRGAG